MTEKECIEFFEQVKGKKIKWSSWNRSYFIPESLNNRLMIGNANCKGRFHYPVYNGFNESKFVNNGNWEFCEEKMNTLKWKIIKKIKNIC